MGALTNKVAIVTGASSGIGRAAAKLFAREGAAVVVVARRKSELDELVAEIACNDGRAALLVGDVANEATAANAVALAVERFGRLDAAFNNAGTLGPMTATTDVSLAGWNEALAINLTSAFLSAKHQVPAMLKAGGGSIVFTSTFVGYTAGFPNMAAYSASKAGVIGLTKALAAELGPSGIRVNALLPGGTDTPMGREVANSPDALAFVKGLHAMKRIASPDEIAQSALHLVSSASSFTTGTAVLVDGGVSIARG